MPKIQKENNDRTLKKSTINFLWITIILSLLLICSIACKLSDQNIVITTISFAATLSSLILSIVAIIYTFITTKESNTTKETLYKVSSDLNDYSSKLSDNIEQLNIKINTIPDNIKRIENIVYNFQKPTEVVEKSPSLKSKDEITNYPIHIDLLIYSLIKKQEKQNYLNFYQYAYSLPLFLKNYTDMFYYGVLIMLNAKGDIIVNYSNNTVIGASVNIKYKTIITEEYLINKMRKTFDNGFNDLTQAENDLTAFLRSL